MAALWAGGRSEALRLLALARQFFGLAGTAFLLWKIDETLRKKRDGLVDVLAEVALVSVIGPGLVWATSKWGERLARQAAHVPGERRDDPEQDRPRAYISFDADRCIGLAREVHPRLDVIRVSATRGDGLPGWYRWLMARATRARTDRRRAVRPAGPDAQRRHHGRTRGGLSLR